jgi:iron complex transport system permease protein
MNNVPMSLHESGEGNLSSIVLSKNEAIKEKKKSRPLLASTIIIVGVIATIILTMVSIVVGAADISLHTVWNAVFNFNPNSTQHQIVYQLRMPRALVAGLIGAALAVSGAIMQGMTRNPLASPGLMGVTAGSSFMIILAFAFFPEIRYHYLIIFSFIGATIGATIVYGTAALARGGLTPVGLALAGAAVSALLGSFGGAINILFELSQDLMFWYAGGVAGAKWIHVQLLLPLVAGGLLLALILSRSITILSLGEEVATGLGQRTFWVKALGSVIVLILTGAAVSTAGAVGFIGLVIPHITRYLVGVDYRWVIPCSAVLGGLLVVIADIGARMINPPFETPIGILTAMVGIPFFLYLARSDRREL